MDDLLKQMKTFDELREAEIQNYKKKCEGQQMTISSMKKSLGMDKLETDFETYKKNTSVKIKSLEDEKLKIKIEKNTLQEKVEDLKKELEAEKTLRKTAEDKVVSLESSPIVSAVSKNQTNVFSFSRIPKPDTVVSAVESNTVTVTAGVCYKNMLNDLSRNPWRSTDSIKKRKHPV